MEQVLNNRINDAWNEPTVIRVLIVTEELKPTSTEMLIDLMDGYNTKTNVVKLDMVTKHPDDQANWQFGVDKMQVQAYIHSWLNLVR